MKILMKGAAGMVSGQGRDQLTCAVGRLAESGYERV